MSIETMMVLQGFLIVLLSILIVLQIYRLVMGMMGKSNRVIRFLNKPVFKTKEKSKEN